MHWEKVKKVKIIKEGMNEWTMYGSKKRIISSDECDLGSRLIHLPHIECFVLFDAFVNLVRFESFGGAAFHDIRDFDCFRCTEYFSDQRKDFIRRILFTVKKKENDLGKSRHCIEAKANVPWNRVMRVVQRIFGHFQQAQCFGNVIFVDDIG